MFACLLACLLARISTKYIWYIDFKKKIWSKLACITFKFNARIYSLHSWNNNQNERIFHSRYHKLITARSQSTPTNSHSKHNTVKEKRTLHSRCCGDFWSHKHRIRTTNMISERETPHTYAHIRTRIPHTRAHPSSTSTTRHNGECKPCFRTSFKTHLRRIQSPLQTHHPLPPLPPHLPLPLHYRAALAPFQECD